MDLRVIPSNTQWTFAELEKKPRVVTKLGRCNLTFSQLVHCKNTAAVFQSFGEISKTLEEPPPSSKVLDKFPLSSKLWKEK